MESWIHAGVSILQVGDTLVWSPTSLVERVSAWWDTKPGQSDPPGLDLPIPAVGECKIVQVILIVKKKVQQNRVLPRFHRNLISVAKNS